MDFEEACEGVIKEFGLIKNKRMAVLYGPNVGDFYCLCSTVEHAEKLLNMEVILLYHSEMQREIVSWFEYGDYTIKGGRITEEVYSAIRGLNLESKKKYQDYLIFWNCGNEDFRKLTRNVSGAFLKNAKNPSFPYVNISQKYKEYVVPKRTVLIVPEARSVQPLPIWFWNFAAYLFEAMGYSVVFNAPPQNAKLYRGKSLLIPISDVVRFADECGFVFGVRTGLFDVLSVSTARLVIFSSKLYKPLDLIYNIDNPDNRIKTFFYDDADPFFWKTEPISYIIKDFDDNFHPIMEMLHKICEYESRNSSRTYPVQILKSYVCKKTFNRYVVEDSGTYIEPFGDFMYSYDISNGKLIFSIRNATADRYRFDYKLFCNEKCLTELNDTHSNCLAYPLEQSGEYYIRATITDLKSFDQEYFETHRLVYLVPVPHSLNMLSLCKDFYSYITALKHFGKEIAAFICSRDSHTFFRKTKDTEVLQHLQMLGLQSDLEGTPRHSYIGIIDGSSVIYEMLSKSETIVHHYESDECDVVIESSGYNATQSSKTSVKIEINGENEAIDKRGLNFVVWDKKSKTVIDSVVFDTFEGNKATRKSSSALVKNTDCFLPAQPSNIMISSDAHTERLNEIIDTAKTLEKQNRRLEKEVAELKKALGNVNELHDRNNELYAQCLMLTEQKSQFEQKLLQTRNLTAELRAEINRLNSAAENSTNEINKLNTENKALEERAAFFENSRSWRITKPLRSVTGFFRKLSGKNKK